MRFINRVFSIGIGLISAIVLDFGPQVSSLPCEHQAYVWQRLWTPAVDSAIVTSKPFLAGLRILAGQMDGSGHFFPVTPHTPSLSSPPSSCMAVFRVDGQIAAPSWDTLCLRIAETIRQWLRANVNLKGIEIDYDCPPAKLQDYTNALRSVRGAIGDSLVLSITALPCWIGNRALGELLAQADETVLQVHSVIGPQRGIFDDRMAMKCVVRFARCCSRPFRVALPAYGSRIEFDEHGQAVAVENEAPRLPDTTAMTRELRADPCVIQTFIRELSRKNLRGLKGVVWFRLPVSGDVRSWSMETLQAVVEDRELYSRFEVVRTEENGTVDFALVNNGTIDGVLPVLEVLAAGIENAEPLSTFAVERRAQTVRFIAYHNLHLHPSQEIPVGWMRCQLIKEIRLHASY